MKSKWLKALLPIGILSATVAITTPMVVSCGDDESSSQDITSIDPSAHWTKIYPNFAIGWSYNTNDDAVKALLPEATLKAYADSLVEGYKTPDPSGDQWVPPAQARIVYLFQLNGDKLRMLYDINDGEAPMVNEQYIYLTPEAAGSANAGKYKWEETVIGDGPTSHKNDYLTIEQLKALLADLRQTKP